MIGATTENPYISINPAIRSRTQILKVTPLNEEEMTTAIQYALADKERGLGNEAIELDDNALQHLARSTNGDLRSALNSLELAVKSTPKMNKRSYTSRSQLSKNVCNEKP